MQLVTARSSSAREFNSRHVNVTRLRKSVDHDESFVSLQTIGSNLFEITDKNMRTLCRNFMRYSSSINFLLTYQVIQGSLISFRNGQFLKTIFSNVPETVHDDDRSVSQIAQRGPV